MHPGIVNVILALLFTLFTTTCNGCTVWKGAPGIYSGDYSSQCRCNTTDTLQDVRAITAVLLLILYFTHRVCTTTRGIRVWYTTDHTTQIGRT